MVAFGAQKNPLAIIVALGLLLRLVVWGGALAAGDARLFHEGDTGTYQALAYAITEGDFLFSEGHAREMAYLRTPGYPLLMGIGYAIGWGDAGIALLQVLLDVGGIYVVYRLGELFGKAGLLAALLYAISPMFILFSFKLVSESFFIFVFLLANWVFFRGMGQSEPRRTLLYAGLLFGFLILVRPIALAFPVFYAAIYYWQKREWKGAAMLLLAAYMVAGLWVARNVLVLGEVSFSRIGPISYACWTGPLLVHDERVDIAPWQREVEEFGLTHPDDCTQKIFDDPGPATQVVTSMAWAYPAVYIQHMLNAALLLFSPQTPNYILDILGQERPHLSLVLFEHGLDIAYLVQVVSQNPVYLALLGLFSVYQLALYALFVWGVWKGGKENQWLLVLVLAMVAYIVVVQGPQLLFSGYRYRMPVEPLLILGAAWGWKVLQRR